ncbi:MAG: ACP S-malonyltransferase [Anaerolineales bacterium]|nr:ACP S-malonyltransferase [Anaerolineales bacterium]MBP6209095.1 ACP S-malonyltransferase [Anaerolineales bacterium]
MKIDITKTAFIFPGQGSQTLGMGKDLSSQYPIAKNTFEEADSILGFELSKMMMEGAAEELNDTVNTQPALFIHSIAAYRTFTHLYPGLKPALLAGHSLGELSALAAAETFSFEDGLRLVRRRAELMKRAGELAPGGMAAILGLDIPVLEKVCAEASAAEDSVQIANDNCPGQVVISGSKPAVERAMSLAKTAGAKRALPLAVSIAAHSALMNPIQQEWNETVLSAKFSNPKIAVIGNVHAAPLTDAASAQADLIAQMQSRVRWTESVGYMTSNGIDTFLEVGTGTVLGGLVKRIANGAANFPLGTPQDFSALTE